MIRTELVALTSIPASAYRQKLLSGGSGIVIIRYDSAQPGVASISKTSGEPILTKNTPKKLFPIEAFKEAMALTLRMPYKKCGTPVVPLAPEPILTEEESDPVVEVVVDSAEYKKIVDTYTDKTGKLSYALLNKDLIKFAHSSSKVREMIGKKTAIDDIRLYIAGTKFRNITGNRDLSDDQVLKIAELLDEVSEKGVFKELNEELRKKK